MDYVQKLMSETTEAERKEIVRQAERLLFGKNAARTRATCGKHRSATNALKHGLTATRPILPGEDIKDYRAMRGQMIEKFSPQSCIERELCDRITNFCWQLRRVPAAEAHLLRRHREDLFDRSVNQLSDDRAPRARLRRYHPAGIIAEVFYRDELKSLDRLGFYESRIERALHRAINTLLALKKVTKQNAPLTQDSVVSA